MEITNTTTITTTNKTAVIARRLVFYQDVMGGKLYRDFKTDDYYFIPDPITPSFFLNEVIAAMKTTKKEIVDKVFFNERKGATCVCWKDGTKTVVKCQPEDDWNKMMGLALCFMKKAYGNKGNFNDFLRKWLEEGKDCER